MVGLSIVLESHNNNKKYHPQVINRATTVIIKPSPATSTRPSTTTFPAAGFLDRCFLCYQSLLPGRDIYMYKGDTAFCSVECRCRQIFMDEEETSISLYKKDNCSSSASAAASRNRKGTRNRANGFAY